SVAKPIHGATWRSRSATCSCWPTRRRSSSTRWRGRWHEHGTAGAIRDRRADRARQRADRLPQAGTEAHQSLVRRRFDPFQPARPRRMGACVRSSPAAEGSHRQLQRRLQHLWRLRAEAARGGAAGRADAAGVSFATLSSWLCSPPACRGRAGGGAFDLAAKIAPTPALPCKQGEGAKHRNEKAGLRRLFVSTRIARPAYASSWIFALRRLLWRAALFLWIRPRAA